LCVSWWAGARRNGFRWRSGIHSPAAVSSLRSRLNLGNAAIGVFECYAKAIKENGGRFYLAGVDDSVRRQLEKTGSLQVIGEDNILPAGDELLASLNQVYRKA
jgi:hypothetical protein